MASLPVVDLVIKVHLSLNVVDLGQSIEFYRVLFGVEPAKRHDDYAKFELDDPPVVFSLVPRAPGPGGSLSHLGFRVADAEAVRLAQERLTAAGICTQDQNGTVCGYARQDKVWARDPDGNFWELYAIEEDVLPETVRRSVEGPAARIEPPVEPSFDRSGGPVVWEHFVTEPLAGPVPHADGSVDEVRLTGTFNAALDDAGREFVVGEAARVLRPGCRVVTHGLMSDRALTGSPPKLPGLAAMVSRVPPRDEAIECLCAAGLVNVQVTKLTEKPWFVHERVGLREVKIIAWKPTPQPNGDTRQILYKGPFIEATADGGWTFPRGQRVLVPASVWHDLRLSAAAEQFLFFEPGAATSCSIT
jgi:catechol 2,3-dioxygenase-like lactoylglutathione lyase family enzyme